MRNRVLFALAAIAVLGLQVVGGVAHAADDLVLVNQDGKVNLDHAGNGEATASITVLNQSPGTDPTIVGVELSAAPGDAATANCTITAPDDNIVDWQREQTFQFTFAAACLPDRKEGTDFTVSGDDGSEFILHANPPKEPDPDWAALPIMYGGAAVVSALLLLAAWSSWKKTEWPNVKRSLDSIDNQLPLPGLDAAWKFSDSWAANATVVTTAFAGVFGASEVTKTLLGDDANNVLAVALVAAAISLGLVGISPMVLQGLRVQAKMEPAENDAQGKPLTKDMPAGLYVTPNGLLVAALCTLTATIGQLTALMYFLLGTDFGDTIVLIVVWGASVALVYWYAWKATIQNLTAGATLPPPDPPKTKTVREARAAIAPGADGPDALFAQAVIVQAPGPDPRRPAGIL